MLIEVELINNPIQLATVLSGNDQPQVEVDFNLQRGTINIDVDLNYNVITNNITQEITQNITEEITQNITNNITNITYSYLTFIETDIC